MFICLNSCTGIVQSKTVDPLPCDIRVINPMYQPYSDNKHILFLLDIPDGTNCKMLYGDKNHDQDGLIPYLRRENDSDFDFQTGMYGDSIPLTMNIQSDGKCCELIVDKSILVEGEYVLHIPKGAILLDPMEYEEADTIDVSEELLERLEVGGAWHVSGSNDRHDLLFTIHDDDGIDGALSSSVPGDYTHGYYSLLFPVLESLGLKGCLSLEGRRSGWTAKTPYANDNMKVAKRLQDEFGWEIMSHSMNCLGERLNNWVVDSIDTPLADRILQEAECHGESNSRTTTIYSRKTKTQYAADENRTKWIPSDSIHIKPYAADYNTHEVLIYNNKFSIDHHWGKWFRLADEFGIKGKSWVMHNALASHQYIGDLAQMVPNGFVDMANFYYNEVPLTTAASRLLCDGQMFGNKLPESSHDNGYDQSFISEVKKIIDEVYDKGGWMVFGLHAYRYCWDNVNKDELVSNGGTYPDSWVFPLEGVDPLIDSLTPPAKLGIQSWSEWYPCPGTRLKMLYDMLKYVIDKGFINVTSSEGFELIGNKKSYGYYTADRWVGYDAKALEDSRFRHPHYIEGANGEKYYYGFGRSAEQNIQFSISLDGKGNPILSSDSIINGSTIVAHTLLGVSRRVERLGQLPPGIWIVNGKKYIIK